MPNREQLSCLSKAAAIGGSDRESQIEQVNPVRADVRHGGRWIIVQEKISIRKSIYLALIARRLPSQVPKGQEFENFQRYGYVLDFLSKLPDSLQPLE